MDIEIIKRLCPEFAEKLQWYIDNEEHAPEELVALAEAREALEWRPISEAPKDGSLIQLTWMENGKPQEIYTMQWGHIQKNGLYPGVVGMWVDPGGNFTWNESNPEGAPTHFRYLPQPPKEGG
ncbi:MAG: hypothetical protein ABFD50_07950 [Smithella sp.]